MAVSARILRQLGKPAGLLGRLILWELNRVNRGMNDVTFEALDLAAGDRVLDIGFGGGALIKRVLAEDRRRIRGRRGYLTACDRTRRTPLQTGSRGGPGSV